MANVRTSDGETGDARFEFGHLIEPDKMELSAEPMPFASTYCSASQTGLFLSYRKMTVILGVNVNAAARIQALARRCLRPCHLDLCEGAKVGP